ncbi:MAG: LptF/LptG family permease [Gemmatimonadota bacterium]|nr:MAG: LptF/LptG family permease [Gemmatimonadota bacterium]
MKILTRYVLKAHIGPFFFGLTIITFVLILDFIIDIFDFILGKSLSPFIVLEVFVLNMAWMLALSLPMAVLVSTLMAFGRLSADNEITAVKASGTNLLSLIVPVLICAFGLALLLVWFNDRVLPESNHRAKNLMSAIHRKRPTLTLKEGVFNNFPGYSILVEKIDNKTSEMKGVTIYEKQEKKAPVTIRAQRGILDFSPEMDRFTITLYHGEIHDRDSQYRRITFEKHVLHVTGLGTELKLTDSKRRGDREMGIRMMQDKIGDYEDTVEEHAEKMRRIVETDLKDYLPERSLAAFSDLSDIPQEVMDRLYRERRGVLQKLQTEERIIQNALKQISRYKVEIHKKISIPAACLVFVLVGAPLAVMTRRGGWPIALGISFFFFVLYWAFLIGGEQLADRRIVPAGWAMWSPNIVIGGIGLYLLRCAVSERFFRFRRRRETAHDHDP